MAAIAVVFGVFEYTSIQRAQQDLRLKLDRLLAVQAAALSGPIWKIDNEQVNLAVEALAIDPDIVSVSVYDEFSDALAQYNANADSNRVAFTGETEIFRDASAGGDPIGKLVIAVSAERTYAEAKRRLLLAAALAAVLLVCVVGSSLIPYRRTIGTPLGRLLKGIQSSQRGTDTARVDWSSNDEMGEVITAFNDMLRQRVAYEGELRTARDELEERVELRTKELAAASAQLTEAIESISEGFSLFDKKDRLLICNTNYMKLMDPKASDADQDSRFATGTPFLVILRRAVEAGLVDAAKGREQEWIAERMRARQSPAGLRSQVQTDGKWVRITERKTHDGSTVAIYTDVTELERARQAAEAANEAKSTFLATMSHEIRTPMNGVLGMLDVLEQSSLSHEQREMTATITQSAMALLAIIDDILDFSKIEAGQIDLEPTTISLREVCESAMTIVAAAARQKGLDLALLIDAAVPPAIESDAMRLRQVLINLLGNAVKFTEQGSVVLRVNLASNGAGGDRIRFDVCDTGVGIAEDRLRDVFTPFRQAERSTTRQFGGTGLGLSISQRLVQRMGGSVGVESKIGVGSTFWFTLPFKVATLPRANPVDEIDLSDTSALVVSASPVVYEMIEVLLVESGACVRGAETPAAATSALQNAAARDEPFDLVVIDGRLPCRAFGLAALTGLDTDERQDPGLRICAGRHILDDEPGAVAVEFRERPPQRDSLLRAVGIVLGRLSPESEILADAGEAQTPAKWHRAPPSIADALSANQLILVVDDHETNREVIQRQLAAMGYTSEVAANGEEALAMWQRTAYALILCDCHMPVLDGFGLTAAIRAAKLDGRVRTPIVALTANALVGEAERCLNAGMDDYLAKPVGLQRLGDTLARWIGRPRRDKPATRAQGNGAPLAIAESSEQSPFDLELWKRTLGEVDLELLRTLVEDFKPTLVDMQRSLELAHAAGDSPALAKTAHRGAGSAASIAAKELSDAFGRLEEAAKAGRKDGINVALNGVRVEAERVMCSDVPDK